MGFSSALRKALRREYALDNRDFKTAPVMCKGPTKIRVTAFEFYFAG